MSDPAPSEPSIDARSIDAIVIGASVGGVEALMQLLPALPGDLPAAVFIVQHLPRDRPSLLADIFGKYCALPLREAEDQEPAAPGTVCFAPPDYHLLVDSGPVLRLSVDDPVQFARPSIDVLFESAADIYGPRLLGIVLTGANADGAAGLAAVHRAGGIAVVQADAVASAMPSAARARVPASFALPLERIRMLLQFGGGTSR
jgi:two-component system chemotaxis response regulator CheB